MDAAVRAVLAEYDARAAHERTLVREQTPGDGGVPLDQFLLRLGADAGAFVNMLVKGMGARAILDLGTSYGYSAVWLAEAARETGGRVISIDLVAEKQAYARAMLEKAGLADLVDFRAGDALEIVGALPGPFDFVVLDIWKDAYAPMFERVYPKLAPGAVVVADNMLYPPAAREMAIAYRRAVRAAPGMTSVLLEIDEGLEVSRHLGPDADKL
jgi:predicted O-methyltransferase YrrM